MSNLGMLGLLEGLGKGAAASGKNILAEAEEKRKLNLLRISRQWNREDAAIDRTNRQEDMKTERTWRQEDNATERDWKKEDTVAEHGWQLERDAQKFDQSRSLQNDQRSWELKNRQPSEFDKRVAKADELLAAGKISPSQHAQVTLGLKGSEVSAEDRADLRMKALDQARQEIAGKDSLQGATPEQLKAIDQRAKEIYQSAVGGDQGGASEGSTGSQINQRVIAEDAKTYANLPVEARDGAKQALKRKGYSDADLALLEQNAEKYEAKKREDDRLSAQNMTKGLISNLPHSGSGPAPASGTSAVASPGKIIDYGRGLLERSH